MAPSRFYSNVDSYEIIIVVLFTRLEYVISFPMDPIAGLFNF